MATRKFPTQTVNGIAKWDGEGIRAWADALAKRLDAGDVEVTVDLDRWGKTADTWKINVFKKRSPADFDCGVESTVPCGHADCVRHYG